MGRIKSVSLSDIWQRTSDKADSETAATLANFALKEDAGVVIQFYSDGLRGAPAIGQMFINSLSAELHNLSAEEMPYVLVISGGAGNPENFKTKYAPS